MFSRRHPYLFSIIILSSAVAVAMICVSVLFAVGMKHSNFVGFDTISGEKVGVIEITGVIADCKDIIHNLKQFRENDAIKAIVLRINSPGGGVGPSQEIFREVRKTVEKKKIVASMGSVAASGGYYIAAGADGIVANPGTITGSIGVIMGYTNFKRLLDKIGLVPVVIKSGEYKDMGSPVRDMKKEERQILENFAKKIHRQFIMDIAEGRKMDQDKVESIADGRIFTGEESINLGLVDRLGNLEDAIEWAGRLGGIKGNVSAVYPREKKFSIFQYIVESSTKKLKNIVTNPSLSAGYIYCPK